uniref:Uncharacterized protein n=1 Tax=Acrobeloides nanus TaxID=290746 RepID=A0A914CY91_9BILA
MLVSFITFSTIVTLLIADLSTRFKHDDRLENDISWDKIQTIYIRRKNLVIIRTNQSNRCFLLPVDKNGRDTYIFHKISKNVAESLGGKNVMRFCHNNLFYLLSPASNSTRIEQNDGLSLSYEERTPRCTDLLLDCSNQKIGESQLCYTWINGVMRMDQSCISSTEFKVSLRKPQGRMLKIQQEQWKICLERRRNGLRC